MTCSSRGPARLGAFLFKGLPSGESEGPLFSSERPPLQQESFGERRPSRELPPPRGFSFLSGLMASCRARRPFSRRSEARRSGEGLLPGPTGLRAGPRRGAGTVSGREGDLQASTGGVHEEMPPCRSRLRRRRPPGTRPPPRPRPRSLPATLATDRNGAAPKRPFVFVFTGSCSPVRAHRRLRGPVQGNAPLP